MTKERHVGVLAQLKNPPGGRDARVMLVALFLDRLGSGVWSAAAVLYFTFVCGLSAPHVGLLLGAAGVAGIAGSPLAGRLASRHPVRVVLAGTHLLRLVTFVLLLVCQDFAALLAVVAVTMVGERAAKTMEMLFATEVAGEERATFRGLARVMMNAGYGVGAGIAALGLAVGTRDAYRALVLANALSFLVAALLVLRTGPRSRSAASGGASQDAAVSTSTSTGPGPAGAGGGFATANPWRDRGYLAFVLLDIPMNLDDAVLNVGLPLWLVSRTRAPHAVIPAFLVVNTVLCVVLQMAVSRRVHGPHAAARAVAGYGVALLVSCGLAAVAASGGPLLATVALLGAAMLVTMAELVRSVSSWELAISLAPDHARPAYLGVAGISQSLQRSAGPVLLTGGVITTGAVGWLTLGTAVTALGFAQRRTCLRRLDWMRNSASGGGAAGVAAVTGVVTVGGGAGAAIAAAAPKTLCDISPAS